MFLYETGPALLENPQGLSVKIWQNYPTPDQPQISQKTGEEADLKKHEILGLYERKTLIYSIIHPKENQ